MYDGGGGLYCEPVLGGRFVIQLGDGGEVDRVQAGAGHQYLHRLWHLKLNVLEIEL